MVGHLPAIIFVSLRRIRYWRLEYEEQCFGSPQIIRLSAPITQVWVHKDSIHTCPLLCIVFPKLSTKNCLWCLERLVKLSRFPISEMRWAWGRIIGSEGCDGQRVPGFEVAKGRNITFQIMQLLVWLCRVYINILHGQQTKQRHRNLLSADIY